MSHTITPNRCGTPVGPLFTDIRPVNACKTGSIAGLGPLTEIALGVIDQIEAQNLFTLNNRNVRVGSGAYGYTDELPGDVTPELAARVISHDGQGAFLLASETETATGNPILLSQGDVR